MSLVKGSKIEAGDWNDLAAAYNSEIVDRRKVSNTKISGAEIQSVIYANSTIDPLIAGMRAVTSGKLVNDDGSLSTSTYNTGTGRGTLIYPLQDHQQTLLQLAKIDVHALPGKSGCSSGCTGLCASTCTGNCKNTCTAKCASDCGGTCTNTCTGDCRGTCLGGCGGCSGGCDGSCSGGCQGSCTTYCSTVCKDSCMGCESSHAGQGCNYCKCGNYPG